MVRIAREIDPRRIEDLKKKIQDEHYLEEAIDRIATIITIELIQRGKAVHEQEETEKRQPQA
ncbi:hypothetical protein [Spirochaeta thermophila]|uniref:Uncharacterized protein n=1 Tax=Winmispira thermophila (strain ATCC 700085 / DSM 6578 / Z-1203) TaxID=869211 RepID=G0GDL3_WINT7|nr:hypothetical protein [Spirochaeta thermophila]AEJ61360.1 hypothetical protein Spith_1088 [Spirochaeta thermophila DSM 6578]